MASEDKKPLSHKERLLRQGMRHFYAYGFNGTTVDAVLEASGVPKGSFYHHFGSKENFAQAVLDRYFEFQRDLLRRWSSAQDLATADKLGGYFDEMAELFVGSDYQRACLAGKFSTEVAATNDTFRSQLGVNLTAWKSEIAALLEAGRGRGDVRTDRSPDELADSVLALIQGAFVVALSNRDDRSLRSVSGSIRLLVEPPAAA